MRKKERSPVKGHEIGKLSSLPLEEEDRSDLRITKIPTLGKTNPNQRMLDKHFYRDGLSLGQWIPKRGLTYKG